MSTERLSGLDASFLYIETPTLHMHVLFAAVYDPQTVPGGYSFEKLRGTIEARIPEAPVFRRRLVEVPFGLDHPLWADDPDFDIDNHFHRCALPDPGGVEQLCDFVSDVVGRKLDRDHPLWEMWVVEGLQGGRIAVVSKMHHATIDGVSGAELLGVLLDLEPTPRAPQPAPAGDDHVPSSFELLGQALVHRLVSPLDVVRMAWKTGSAVLGVARVRQDASGKAALPLSAPKLSINASVGSRRRVAFAAVGLDDVKRLKKAMGVTVNDVVLGVATSVLRRYLEAGDELPDQPLVAVVPVSVRPETAELRGSNKVSGMFVPLPVNEPAPLRRLQLIHESTKGAKEEHDALGADTLQNWAEHASPNVFAAAVRLYTRMRLAERHRPVANLVISNVPGPSFPLYLGGAELLACFPLGPVMEGMGLNITIMSYRGVLYWGFVSCARSVPGLWDLAAAVPQALEELLGDAGLATSATGVPIDLGPGMPLARFPRAPQPDATVTSLDPRARLNRGARRAGAAPQARREGTASPSRAPRSKLR